MDSYGWLRTSAQATTTSCAMFGRGNPLAISPGRRCAEGGEGSEIRTAEAWKSECVIYTEIEHCDNLFPACIVYFLHVLSSYV